MARYIDAEKLIKELGNCTENTWGKGLGASWWAQSVKLKDNMVKCIESQPTADVVEVKHGVWYKSQFVQRSGFRTVKDFLCNRCEKEYSVQQPSNLMNYCPYCGAKMDGGNDDD